MDFVQQKDQAVSKGIQHVAFCPAFDLVALVLGDMQIVVERFLTKQRILVISGANAKEITSLCWAPHGRTFVVGDVCGRFLLYDVELGSSEFFSETVGEGCSIIQLSWFMSQQKYNDHLYVDQAIERFPNISYVYPLKNHGEVSTVQLLSSHIYEKTLNVLFVCALEGIYLYVYGIHKLAFISFESMNMNVKAPGYIFDINVSPCFSFVSMLHHESSFINLNSRCLKSYNQEICTISLEMLSFSELFTYVELGFQAIDNHWDRFFLMIETQMFRVIEVQKSYCSGLDGINKHLCDVFLELLSCGTVPEFLRAVLSSSGCLSIIEITKLQTALDATVQCFNSVLVSCLIPYTEELLFRASQFAGRACLPVFKDIGFDSELIDNLVELCTKLRGCVEVLKFKLLDIENGYRLWLKWLLKVQIEYLENTPLSRDVSSSVLSSLDSPVGENICNFIMGSLKDMCSNISESNPSRNSNEEQSHSLTIKSLYRNLDCLSLSSDPSLVNFSIPEYISSIKEILCSLKLFQQEIFINFFEHSSQVNNNDMLYVNPKCSFGKSCFSRPKKDEFDDVQIICSYFVFNDVSGRKNSSFCGFVFVKYFIDEIDEKDPSFKLGALRLGNEEKKVVDYIFYGHMYLMVLEYSTISNKVNLCKYSLKSVKYFEDQPIYRNGNILHKIFSNYLCENIDALQLEPILEPSKLRSLQIQQFDPANNVLRLSIGVDRGIIAVIINNYRLLLFDLEDDEQVEDDEDDELEDDD